MILKVAVPVLALVAACAAQAPPSPSFPAALKQYLGMTDAQAEAVLKLNDSYDEMALGKFRRTFQLEREIELELEKDLLDPVEIGRRHMEIEVIRRELREELVRLRAAALRILDDGQKLKLKALEEALALTPLALDAQCASLLTPPGVRPKMRLLRISTELGMPSLLPVLNGIDVLTRPSFSGLRPGGKLAAADPASGLGLNTSAWR